MCECQNTRKYYRYYDTPDGCNVDKKIMTTARYGIVTGLIVSAYDVLMYSHAVGFIPVIKRYMYHTIPLGLMGATFAAVANGVLRYRSVDDHLNYFAGGVACAPILAAYYGSVHALVPGALLLGIGAMIKKEAIETGTTLFPHPPGHMNSINGWRKDYTFVKDPRDELLHTCSPPKKTY